MDKAKVDDNNIDNTDKYEEEKDVLDKKKDGNNMENANQSLVYCLSPNGHSYEYCAAKSVLLCTKCGHKRIM